MYCELSTSEADQLVSRTVWQIAMKSAETHTKAVMDAPGNRGSLGWSQRKSGLEFKDSEEGCFKNQVG